MILNRVSSERHLSLLKDGRVAFEVDDSQHVRPTFTKDKKNKKDKFLWYPCYLCEFFEDKKDKKRMGAHGGALP